MQSHRITSDSLHVITCNHTRVHRIAWRQWVWCTKAIYDAEVVECDEHAAQCYLQCWSGCVQWTWSTMLFMMPKQLYGMNMQHNATYDARLVAAMICCTMLFTMHEEITSFWCPLCWCMMIMIIVGRRKCTSEYEWYAKSKTYHKKSIWYTFRVNNLRRFNLGMFGQYQCLSTCIRHKHNIV